MASYLRQCKDFLHAEVQTGEGVVNINSMFYTIFIS